MSAYVDNFRSAIASELGLEPGAILPDVTFEALGLDPLAAMEVLEIVNDLTGVEFPASLFRDCRCLSDIGRKTSKSGTTTRLTPASGPSPVHVAYSSTSGIVGKYAKESGVADFWTNVYPSQRRLVLAYVSEAMAALGQPLAHMPPGTPLSIPSDILAKHSKLMEALLDILVDGGVMQRVGTRVVRSSVVVDLTPSSTIYEQIARDFPQHADTHRLLNITGSNLAGCLTGSMDPIKLLFGSSLGRDMLFEFYTNAPMSIAASKQLSDFFKNAFISSLEPIEILEIGAGFGGTTKFVLDMLISAGIRFKYTFTDISSSFFKTAKKRYAELHLSDSAIEYEVLDIEKPIPDKFRGRFHAVLSTNCIHATKNLQISCTNARQLLRTGGFFSVVEFSTRLYWLDLVFGLLDGWWLFNDGRNHCIAEESFWMKSMHAAGFQDVIWTKTLVDGKRPNPQVIVATTE
ncbi:putative secondary metabolism biosynthetic enzyme [Purpureocillium takamizusanense]|uniref:Secondary metabolism biosynthetic enzyme n=1 Tax=Purpureocillium takamizusanense TaxID=2060973 RepID=A0A9Q8VFR9_9HYPO|nr:putative secondary metabolism biosynthetic enzyme [Purpureocillium takamizusanense]UNI23898.1 putative secondary metabolism biosynthetic enzyme [Purpureocillium takamizusanense]